MMHGLGFIWMILPFLFAGAVVYLVVRAGGTQQRQIDKTAADRSATRGIEEESSTERKIYLLARKNGGSLTVSDVVADIGLPATEAEHRLQEMTDEMRVRMEVSDDGVVTYHFPEFGEHR